MRAVTMRFLPPFLISPLASAIRLISLVLPTRKRSASPLLSTAFFGAFMSRLFAGVIQI